MDAVFASGDPVESDPRRKRGGTIPSIQEFLDAIEKVGCVRLVSSSSYLQYLGHHQSMCSYICGDQRGQWYSLCEHSDPKAVIKVYNYLGLMTAGVICNI